MRPYIITIVALTISTIAALAFGQPPASAAASSPVVAIAQPQAKESPELAAAKDQIRLLQTQVQVMKDYHSSLLDTVYWALGGVFMVVSIILGFGWFANFKVYERDKQAMRDELDAQLKSQRAELTEKTANLSAELTESVTAQLEKAATSLHGQVTSEIAKAIDPVNRSISRVRDHVLGLQLNGLKDKMQANPSDNMALTDALAVLELCKDRAQDELPDTMNFMLKKIDKGGRLTAQEITRVNAVLDALPAHYKALSDRLRAKLVASDIF